MTEVKKHCTMILLAGGSGKRMGTDIPKQFLEIKGKPVLAYSLKAVEESEIIDDCVLVIRPEDEDYINTELLQKYGFSKVKKLAYAGRERYESVWNGLQQLDDLAPDYVFIHDGARPFIDEAIIRNCFEGVEKHGACVAAVKAKDTVKIVAADGKIISTPDRNTIWNMQTPQTFRTELIREAYRIVMGMGNVTITDDAQAVETAGLGTAFVVPGSYNNIKVTTPEDLQIAEVLTR